MEENQEAWIPTERCRCGSQETAGSGGIQMDVDSVVATPTCK